MLVNNSGIDVLNYETKAGLKSVLARVLIISLLLVALLTALAGLYTPVTVFFYKFFGGLPGVAISTIALEAATNVALSGLTLVGFLTLISLFLTRKNLL